jgi:hypothetical protein
MRMQTRDDADAGNEAGDVEPVTGQPIEEAEKNLSRHATKDSSPPVGEERRTSVAAGDDGNTAGGNQTKRSE